MHGGVSDMRGILPLNQANVKQGPKSDRVRTFAEILDVITFGALDSEARVRKADRAVRMEVFIPTMSANDCFARGLEMTRTRVFYGVSPGFHVPLAGFDSFGDFSHRSQRNVLSDSCRGTDERRKGH
jgi:hypothetical protein